MKTSPLVLLSCALSLGLTALPSCQKSSTSEPSLGPETGGGGGAGVGGMASGGQGEAKTPVGMLKREGTLLVDEAGETVFLRGVAFGNNIWAGLSTPPQFHHSAVDYQRVRNMGMNAVRFYLNYQLFESDAAPYEYREQGFDWIDQNVKWAKEHGVVLLLNMHFPQGGFQSNGEGAALWEEPENQARFTALWAEIAERYQDEPTIAGFDLLNEPRPTTSRDEWETLAQATTAAIRATGAPQPIVLERTLSVGDDFDVNDEQNFFLLEDDNVIYEFHFYSPIEYTHQFAEWIGYGDGGKYPDSEAVSAEGATWKDWNHTPTPPYVLAGTSDWQKYESVQYTIPEGVNLVGAVLVSELNAGSAYFDELVVREYSAEGEFVRNVLEDSLDDVDGFYFWSEDGSGEAGLETEGCYKGACAKISGTTHDANYNNQRLVFVPVPGHTYSVGGWMKGLDISSDSRPDPRGNWTQESRALFRLDYFEAEGGVGGRDKESLARGLDSVVEWGKKNQVPLYLGEFGVIHHCFENGKGGLRWIGDMLDLAIERDLHFTYHSYHEVNFPIYQSNPTQRLPTDADAVPGLVELFHDKLGN